MERRVLLTSLDRTRRIQKQVSSGWRYADPWNGRLFWANWLTDSGNLKWMCDISLNKFGFWHCYTLIEYFTLTIWVTFLNIINVNSVLYLHEKIASGERVGYWLLPICNREIPCWFLSATELLLKFATCCIAISNLSISCKRCLLTLCSYPCIPQKGL